MKFRLMTPGPTPAPEEVLLELAKPMTYHRTPEARQILGDVVEDLKKMFVTKNAVMPLTSSGTGSLEAAVTNLVPPGSKAICLVAGKFGERFKNICVAMGVEPVAVTVPYGQAVTPDMLAQALKAHPDAVAVCSTLSETSTGIGHDIEAFGKLVAKTPTALIVDAISGLGPMECRVDAWNIDVCCTGSQKALMLPPGLAFVTVSDKGWKIIDKNPNPRSFYFDLKKARKSIETNDTPYTPAHVMFRAARVSLKKIVSEGMENIWARHARYAQAARAGFLAMGLEIFPARPNNALSVAKAPANLDSTTILKKLEKDYGFKLADGQDSMKGKIIRMSHMGYIDQFDIMSALAGLELVLKELGQPVEVGASLMAAQKVFAGA